MNIFNDFEILDLINLDEMMWDTVGSVNTELVITDATHILTSDNIVLKQAYLLAIANTLHNLTSDDVKLSLYQELVISNALHTLSSDNVDLIQHFILEIINTLHRLTSDNIVLTQAHVLTIVNALHSLTSNNLVLSQSHLLAITNTIHALSSNNIDFTSTQLLDIANTLHSLTSNNITLTQAHLLDIADTIHAIISNNLTLSTLTGGVHYGDWRDYKGLGVSSIPSVVGGPFSIGAKTIFTAPRGQGKNSYNEGNLIATFGDSVWGTVRTGIPITPTHKPCNYWPKPVIFYILGNNIPLTPLDTFLASIQSYFPGVPPATLDIILAIILPVYQMHYDLYYSHTWKSISIKNLHLVAVRSDGTLWVSGYGTYGQLGLGIGTAFTTTLTQVGTDTDWAFCSAGPEDTFAIKTDGSLWACGRNSSSHLGTGDFVTQWTLVNVGTGYANVTSNNADGIAIKTNGTIWACGATTHTNVFVQADAGTIWESAAAMHNSAVAIKTDGTLWAVGDNSYGQLGVGDFILRPTLVQVGSDSDWKLIHGEYSYCLATKDNDDLYGWGKSDVPGFTNTPTFLGTRYMLLTGGCGNTATDNISMLFRD
jgi:hypothetical protein